MNDIYLLTGGNIGNRLHYLQQAYKLIEHAAGTVVKKSSIYETAPWGFIDQQPFLNQVLCVTSTKEPVALLQTLLEIELQLGRKRTEKMGPRVIDIDILFYKDQIVELPNLTIPHPRITERRFVLTPLNEIATGFTHPVFKKTIHELLITCNDTLEVSIYNPTS